MEVHLGLPVSETYIAVVKDKNSNIMPSEMVTWTLETPVSGVSVDSNTGVVTIASVPDSYSFVLVATSVTDPTKLVRKTVSIT